MAKIPKAGDPPARGGRPSLYKPEYAEQAQKLCLLGATDATLANFFEVAISTISLWKVKYPEFSEALKVGKAVADDAVERSLYAKAVGYEHDEIDIRVVDHEIVQTPIRRKYPPDSVAIIFWLKNRRPDKWRSDNGQQGARLPGLDDPDPDV